MHTSFSVRQCNHLDSTLLIQSNTWVASRLRTPQLNSRAWGMVTLVAWRWLQVECFFFCWGGHKSSQVAAFTFSALLALAVKMLRDTKGQLLLLSSLRDTIICLCCRGFSSDHGWLTQRQAQTCQQWVWQETSSIKTVYTGAIHSQSGATSF